MKNVPRNCAECEFGASCTNPAPYGMYRCRYKDEIQKYTVEKIIAKGGNAMAKVLDLGPAIINCASATTVEDKKPTDNAEKRESSDEG